MTEYDMNFNTTCTILETKMKERAYKHEEIREDIIKTGNSDRNETLKKTNIKT